MTDQPVLHRVDRKVGFHPTTYRDQTETAARIGRRPVGWNPTVQNARITTRVAVP
jgi:hypothetical protein